MGANVGRWRAALWLMGSALLLLVEACAAAGAAAPADDGQLLRSLVRQQEQVVAAARARLDESEHALATARLGQRILRESGRLDLAARLDGDEPRLERQVAEARRALIDAKDTLAAYRAYGRRQGAVP